MCNQCSYTSDKRDEFSQWKRNDEICTSTTLVISLHLELKLVLNKFASDKCKLKTCSHINYLKHKTSVGILIFSSCVPLRITANEVINHDKQI